MPIRSQGSRWINHKRRALLRFVDRYGAYLHHLYTLLEDQTVRGEDRAKLKGYVKKWEKPRMLVGAALYIDVLKSPSALSLAMQEDNLDVVSGIQYILKSRNSLITMSEQGFLEWPTLKLVMSRIKIEGAQHLYQGVVLQGYSSSLVQECGMCAELDLKKLDQRMRSR